MIVVLLSILISSNSFAASDVADRAMQRREYKEEKRIQRKKKKKKKAKKLEYQQRPGRKYQYTKPKSKGD